MTYVASGLWRDLIAVQIYGANTGVGKTIVSSILGRHFVHRGGSSRSPTLWRVQYLKPVSTGPLNDADDSYVAKYAGIRANCLHQFRDPVSPHIAARAVQANVQDDSLVADIYANLSQTARSFSPASKTRGITLVETAGGVLSPGPSGTPQADLYRPLRLPVILVGDHRLGGIAATLSAYESLHVRGYDVDAVVMFEDRGLGNSEYLSQYLRKWKTPVYTLPFIPFPASERSKKEEVEMTQYYEMQSRNAVTYDLAGSIIENHDRRVEDISAMPAQAQQVIWHPFAQHKGVKSSDILAIDSAYGDYLQIKHTPATAKTSAKNESNIDSISLPAFDGSASWWTQGLGHGNPVLSLSAAHAAGRYGHVIFAATVHQPALALAQRLLTGLNNPRLTKVFYTDNGSTAVEVGIKMALRAACQRYGWDGSEEEIGIIGLKGSYHGDTIGAMDASEPGVYNKKVDWYRGRGYWFDFPCVKMRKGVWVVEAPPGMEEEFGSGERFDSLDDVFDFARRDGARYKKYIKGKLRWLTESQGRKFGALVMEPVLLGAGGMLFADPLFQRTLVEEVRALRYPTSSQVQSSELNWTGLPILADEVFTGLYRLGRFSASSFLGILPDISVHAKLLTGGLLPLSVTVASESIFAAFLGDEKSDALLHGHSYTAHPMGCHVANVALGELGELMSGDGMGRCREDWVGVQVGRESGNDGVTEGIWSMWSKSTVKQLSHHPNVDGVIAIGSVLAISLIDKSGSGYTSNAAVGLRDQLLRGSSETNFHIHSRVLGNVLYLMSSLSSKPKHLTRVEKALIEAMRRVFS